MIQIPPIGKVAKLADIIMYPFMMILTAWGESPQRTHRWNNIELYREDVVFMRRDWMVLSCGVTQEQRRWLGKIPIFHLPILGGWKHFIVIQPEEDVSWHVGWICADGTIGASRLEMRGPVRVLIGPCDVRFFGILAGDDTQIRLKQVGEGHLGDRGGFTQVPLL